MALAAALIVADLAGPAALAADVAGTEVAHRHAHHHRVARLPVETEPPLVPQGYAYGGYGNGPGPGWSDDGRYGPPGYGPGYGYIPPGSPDAGFDLGR